MRKLLIILLSLFSVAYQGQSILIYGGSNHDVFLGCMNCSKYENSSIWNKYGIYGSKYNEKSIWNKYSNYSGKYSNNSPFNKYASTPPVLVDSKGNFYGYFTANKYKVNRTEYELAQLIIDYWESIKEDVGEYYDKIFR